MKATSTNAKSRCALFAALALLHAPNARANDCKPDAEAKAIMMRGVYSFAWENDAFGGDHKDSDRYYTNGLKAAWVSPTLRKRNYDCASQSELFAWVDEFNDLMLLRRMSGDDPDAIKRNVVIGLGQSMYTPSGTRRDRPELNRNDRPYAGWLYLSYGLNARIDANTTQASDTLHALELNVGMVGRASHAKQLHRHGVRLWPRSKMPNRSSSRPPRCGPGSNLTRLRPIQMPVTGRLPTRLRYGHAFVPRPSAAASRSGRSNTTNVCSTSPPHRLQVFIGLSLARAMGALG